MLEKRKITPPYVPERFDADYDAFDNTQTEDEFDEDQEFPKDFS